MLRHSVLGSSRPAQPTHVMPPRASKPLYSCSWLHCASAVVLCALSLVWGIRGVAAADQAGFSKHCAGLAQDPLLGALWPDTPERNVEKRSAVLMAMVPRLSLRGTALVVLFHKSS
jgi:hypothetical protein